MKTELLKYLLLEEIRLHSQLRGSKSFIFFPITLFIAISLISFLLIKFSMLSALGGISFGALSIFFLFGILSGTFGLHATDYLERRFGDYGKLFSNALVLPINLSSIFLMTALSDLIFYFGWFILPLIGGSTLGIYFAGASILSFPALLLSTSMAFILGLSISFLLSITITKSKVIFFILLSTLSGISVYGFLTKGMFFFLPYNLYYNFNLANLGLNILLITLFFVITSRLIGNEFSTVKKKGHYNSFNFKGINHFLFKDFIDLHRTHGLIAKPLFNVIIPSVILLALFGSLSIFQGELSVVTSNLVFIAILLGTLSINFFNVIISGDSFDYYIFLPTSLKEFIWPKMVLVEVICSVQNIILITIYAFINKNFENLFASFIILSAFIFYTMCVNFFINGLKPNENSLNIISMAWMILIFFPAILTGMVIPVLYPSFLVFMIFSAILVVAGYWFYKKGIRKWS